MAEVKRVSGKMQLGTKGGVAQATYEMVVSGKAVGVFTGEIGIFTGEIGVTNADLGNKEAAGNFTCEIGIAKAEPGIKVVDGSSSGTKAEPPSGTRKFGFLNDAELVNKEAAGSSNGGIGATKALLVNKEAVGSSNGGIGIGATKALLVNKEAAGSSNGGIGATKALLVNKEAAGSSTGGIGATKALLVNKKAAGSFTGKKIVSTNTVKGKREESASFTKMPTASDIGFTKTASGTGMLTEASWIDYVIMIKKEQYAFLQGRKAEPMEQMTTKDGILIIKEKVPDAFVDILKKRSPCEKYPPINEVYFNYLSKNNPKLLELREVVVARMRFCVDLHHDILKQNAEKGFAEVGVR